jgi:hypothetical protein
MRINAGWFVGHMLIVAARVGGLASRSARQKDTAMNQSFEETQSKSPNTLFALIGRCKSHLARAVSDARDRAARRAEFSHLRDTGLDHSLNLATS